MLSVYYNTFILCEREFSHNVNLHKCNANDTTNFTTQMIKLTNLCFINHQKKKKSLIRQLNLKPVNHIYCHVGLQVLYSKSFCSTFCIYPFTQIFSQQFHLFTGNKQIIITKTKDISTLTMERPAYQNIVAFEGVD